MNNTDCLRCNGDGFIEINRQTHTTQTCPECKGTGRGKIKILVMGRQSAEQFKSEEKYIMISITSPYSPEAKIKVKNSLLAILRLSFHDWDAKDKELIEQKDTLESKRMIYFNREMAREILLFVMCYIKNINLIVVHCEAGISRSAGVAGAIAKCFCGDDNYYFKHYLPNMLVYDTIIKEWNERK